MASEMHSEGARIFQFPLRPRLRLDNGRTAPATAVEAMVSVVDQCFYHDEAVRSDTTDLDRQKPC